MDVDDPGRAYGLAVLLSERPGPVDVLPLPVLVEDLAAWHVDRRDEPWRRNRERLRADWQATRAAVTGAYATAVDAELSAYAIAVEKVLGEGAPTPAQRRAALGAGATLLNAARSGSARRAAWQDLLAAAQAPEPVHAELRAALTVLSAAAEAAGFDVPSFRYDLAAVLEDDAERVGWARHRAHGQPLPEDRRALIGQHAGLPLPDRLALCEGMAASAAPAGHCVVWLAFKDAPLDGLVPAGTCTFMSSTWYAQAAEEERPGPGELDGSSGLPDPEDGVVLVRVDLGHRPVAAAVAAAVDLAQALVVMASVDGDGEPWRPYGWERLVVDGAGTGSRTFVPDAEVATLLAPGRRRRTARRLAGLGPAAGRALASGGLPPDLAEALRAGEAARTADPRAQVMLRQAASEIVAARARLDSPRDIDDLLLHDWWWTCWRTDVLHVVNDAVMEAALHTDYAAGRDLDRRLRTTTTTDGDYELHLPVLFEERDAVLALFPDSVQSAQAWDVLAVAEDPDAWRAYRDARHRERDLLLGRLLRVRNALAHGNPVHQTVLDSVLPLSEYLGQAALKNALLAHRERRDLHGWLTDLRERRRARDSELENSSTLRRQIEEQIAERAAADAAPGADPTERQPGDPADAGE